MDNTIQLLPVHLDQLPALDAAARADKHVLIHPTHIVLRSVPDRPPQIVGYASLGSVRMMFAWLDSNKLTAPESFRAWRMAREEMAKQGGPVALPCTFDSPLLPFVERMGYKGIFDARIHLRG
jgi:hypothetical protein